MLPWGRGGRLSRGQEKLPTDKSPLLTIFLPGTPSASPAPSSSTFSALISQAPASSLLSTNQRILLSPYPFLLSNLSFLSLLLSLSLSLSLSSLFLLERLPLPRSRAPCSCSNDVKARGGTSLLAPISFMSLYLLAHTSVWGVNPCPDHLDTAHLPH